MTIRRRYGLRWVKKRDVNYPGIRSAVPEPVLTIFRLSEASTSFSRNHGSPSLFELSSSRLRQPDLASVSWTPYRPDDSFLDPLCPFSAKITRSLTANVIPLVTNGGQYESQLQVIPWLYAQPL